MSGSLNSFRANLTFGNLNSRQFDALYEEVLKEKARRLIGEEALNTGMSWQEVSLTADLRLSNGHCHVIAQTWDLTNKAPVYPEGYNPHVIRGFDYRKGHCPPGQTIPTGENLEPIVMPDGTAILASGSIVFRGWDD